MMRDKTNEELGNEPEHRSASLDLSDEIILQPTPPVPIAYGIISLLNLFWFVYNSAAY
jgi:hypothetical protein